MMMLLLQKMKKRLVSTNESTSSLFRFDQRPITTTRSLLMVSSSVTATKAVSTSNDVQIRRSLINHDCQYRYDYKDKYDMQSQWRSYHNTCSVSFAHRYAKSLQNIKKNKSKNAPQQQEPSRAVPNRLSNVMKEDPNAINLNTKTFNKNTATNIALPDRDKEKDLSHMQVQVTELYRLGEYAKALKQSKLVLSETEEHFGKSHPVTASSYNNIGLMYKLLGDFDNSRKQYTTALSIYKDIVGVDHSSYASILHNLGNLNRTQVHVDTTLNATDRLSLIESSIDYLHQAYVIRCNELGLEHPHTVSTRSSWGTSIATQILHHYKVTSIGHDKTSGDLQRKRFYLSLLPQNMTETAWRAAEEHLREALQIATEQPRGECIPIQKDTTTSSSSPMNHNIRTISAASAAQNLAIFLKFRATTIEEKDDDDHNNINEQQQMTEKDMLLKESYELYQQIMYVQRKLLASYQQHPDYYTTRFSYAELLEAMDDIDGANIIRQEILDTYDPPAEDDADRENDDGVEKVNDNSSDNGNDNGNDIVSDRGTENVR